MGKVREEGREEDRRKKRKKEEKERRGRGRPSLSPERLGRRRAYRHRQGRSRCRTATSSSGRFELHGEAGKLHSSRDDTPRTSKCGQGWTIHLVSVSRKVGCLSNSIVKRTIDLVSALEESERRASSRSIGYRNPCRRRSHGRTGIDGSGNVMANSPIRRRAMFLMRWAGRRRCG